MNSRSIWKFFTSLRLTVACLAIGVALVFLGTIAQVNEGLYQSQAHWFKSYFVWWEPKGHSWKIPFFPGGYLLGIVLLLNLFAAHTKRFTWDRRKLGIQATHFGVMLLLVGQLATDMFSRESLITLGEGESTSYSQDAHNTELVFISDAGNGQDRVVSFDQPLFSSKKEITESSLPFTIHVKSYYSNAEVLSRKNVLETDARLQAALATVQGEFAAPEGLPAQAQRAEETEGRAGVWREAMKAVGEKPGGDIVATAQRLSKDPVKGPELCAELASRFRAQMMRVWTMRGGAMAYVAEREAGSGELIAEATLPAATSSGPGKDILIVPKPEGTSMDDRNLPAAILELTGKSGSLGEWVVSPILQPQELSADGQRFRAALRFIRYVHPFSITMLKTTHDIYRGTDIPKDYRSKVRVDNATTTEHREVEISMNHPLRYQGLTFYQYQMSREQEEDQHETSTLQVVHNPSWLTPYLGCALVALGMIYQFLSHLIAFVGRRTPPPLATAAVEKQKRRAAVAEKL